MDGVSIVLCTVPHTGTQFFHHLLAEHFTPMGLDGLEAGERGLVSVHVYGPHLDRLQRIRNRFVLATTERDKAKVRASWINRRKKLERFDEAWALHERLMTMNPFVLSVDAEDRDRRLREFSKRIGVDLKTDWAPVNEWKGERIA